MTESATKLEQLLQDGRVGFAKGNPSLFLDESVSRGVCYSRNYIYDLEIAFRSLLAKFISEDLGNEHILMLIEFACLLAKQSQSNLSDEKENFCDNCGRIPCILLEDLLEGQTITSVDKMWKGIVEPLTNHLTHDSVFGRGSTTLLRVCNGILRKLSQSVNTDLCGRILMFLAHVFPVSERSAVNLTGKNNIKNVTRVDEQSEVEGNGDGMYDDLHRDEYSDFWLLQSLLSTDLKTLRVQQLRGAMQRVLDILEVHGITSTSGLAATKNSKDAASLSLIGQKYLTDSQLFPLELADGQFRQQICIQVLMACQHLRSLENEPEEKKKHIAKLLLVKDIETRAFSVLEDTPNGNRLAETVRQALYREGFWRNWKSQSCPPFSTLTNNSDDRDILELTWPRTCDLDSSTLAGAVPRSWFVDRNQLSGSFAWSQGDLEVKKIAQSLAKEVPTYKAHIEAFLEADDPEAGIEDEYHPKHDALYCWRARKLLAHNNLRAIEAMPDGDLRKGVQAAVSTREVEGVMRSHMVTLRPLFFKKAPFELVEGPKSVSKGDAGELLGEDGEEESDIPAAPVEEERSEIADEAEVNSGASLLPKTTTSRKRKR